MTSQQHYERTNMKLSKKMELGKLALKIGLGLMVINILVGWLGSPSIADRPADPEIGRDLVIEHLNNVERERIRIQRETK